MNRMNLSQNVSMSDLSRSRPHHLDLCVKESSTAVSSAAKDAFIARLECLNNSAMAEMSELRTLSAERECRCRLENEELRRENKVLEARLAQMERDMEDKKALHEYASLIIEAGDKFGQRDSTYVVRLQSKLCKAIHQRAMWSQQMVVFEDNWKKIVKTLQEDVVNAENEKCKAQVEAMNAIIVAEKHKCQMEVECEDKIEAVKAAYEAKLREVEQKQVAQQQEIEHLEAQLEMEKETRASLVSVCTQKQDEQRYIVDDESNSSMQERWKQQDEILNQLKAHLRVSVAVTEEKEAAASCEALTRNSGTFDKTANETRSVIAGQNNNATLSRTGSMLSQLRSNLVRSQSLWGVKGCDEDVATAQDSSPLGSHCVKSRSLRDVKNMRCEDISVPQSASYFDKKASGGHLPLQSLLPSAHNLAKKDFRAKSA
eukprot:CAMPEP_0197463200 /NCGR_PEP_ID=MMETSP1175-20131217/61175_1 /TAXON_ID=1003142 /ORGANISM="Triceratium dubium, Strain CCMP147" /LENGTH=428 /DNA_ID=CAMNT_0042998901 /DNA_START=134 /DNA_END=1420 /DNA_ORIENTATION=+